MQSTPHGTGGNRVDIPLSESQYQIIVRTCSGLSPGLSFHGLTWVLFSHKIRAERRVHENKKIKKGLQGAAISLNPNDVMARAMRVVSHK